jgi:glycosyltransferase involved in cell wall biosynthesis
LKPDRPFRFAIVGTRGIPARYGGFETFAEELSTRLAERGHEVSVYCRQRHTSTEYEGVHLRYLPTIRHKYLDTIAHTAVSTLHLLAHPVDAALYCNAANAVFTWMPRLARIPVALNVDGLERNRKKWNRVARAWYQTSEYLATICPNVIVSDAERIAEYYRERYGRDSVFIPYGAPIGKVPGTDTLQQLGLDPGQYFLYVSRMEPENNALLVRESFERLETNMKLVLIGDAPYAPDYIARVRDTRDLRVVIPGAIYGQGYHELQSHCFAYIQATEVGGTHPALIESMGRGALTLFLETPENTEVAGGAAIPFSPESLTGRLRDVLTMTEAECRQWRERAVERVRERYSWDAVTTAYERLLIGLIRQ